MEEYHVNGSKVVNERFIKPRKQVTDFDYVSENAYVHKVAILRIPLSFENLFAFVVIIILALFGSLYICKLATRQYCR